MEDALSQSFKAIQHQLELLQALLENQKRGLMSEDRKWIFEIKMTVGCVNGNEVKTGSICRVSEKIREAEAEAKAKGYSYRPQFGAMGPFHRGTRSDLQIMEETKWRFMNKLLSRPTQNMLMPTTVESCCEIIIKYIESLIRASYGEKIKMEAEELARIMLLDACFLLELLLSVKENKIDPPLDDQKRILSVLADLTLLENQIPFVLLTTLSSQLFKLQEEAQQQSPEEQAAQQQELASLLALSQGNQLSLQKIAESLFGCNVAGVDFSQGVFIISFISSTCAPLIPINTTKTNSAILHSHCSAALESSKLLESLLRLTKLTILKELWLLH